MASENKIDVWIAEYVLGHQVIVQKKGTIKERTRQGHIRPLRAYSREMNSAWEVAERLAISLIPIKDGSWFALVGKGDGWAGPADLIAYLQTGDFAQGGAALAKSPALSICLAALRSIEKRDGLAFEGLVEIPTASGLH